MRICLATVHSTTDFIPLALLYLQAYLVQRTGVEPGDIAIREGGPVDRKLRRVGRDAT